MSSELSDHLCGWQGKSQYGHLMKPRVYVKRVEVGGRGYYRMVSKGSHLPHLQALQFCLPVEP